MDGVFGIIVICVLFVLYFLPLFIADRRQHPQRVPISIINLFFGWTLLGWVICLAWACQGLHEQEEEIVSARRYRRR